MTDDENCGGPFARVLRATVSGRVQGVGYRDWARAQAQALGLEGFVRNRAGGEVEAVIAGPAQAVALMCERFWRGPPASRVVSVDLQEADASALDERGSGRGFMRLPTV